MPPPGSCPNALRSQARAGGGRGNPAARRRASHHPSPPEHSHSASPRKRAGGLRRAMRGECSGVAEKPGWKTAGPTDVLKIAEPHRPSGMGGRRPAAHPGASASRWVRNLRAAAGSVPGVRLRDGVSLDGVRGREASPTEQPKERPWCNPPTSPYCGTTEAKRLRDELHSWLLNAAGINGDRTGHCVRQLQEIPRSGVSTYQRRPS